MKIRYFSVENARDKRNRERAGEIVKEEKQEEEK
jgi:hypothetical protein